jgi:hypothetical protein
MRVEPMALLPRLRFLGYKEVFLKNKRHPEGRERAQAFFIVRAGPRDLEFDLIHNARSLTPTQALIKARLRQRDSG